MNRRHGIWDGDVGRLLTEYGAYHESRFAHSLWPGEQEGFDDALEAVATSTPNLQMVLTGVILSVWGRQVLTGPAGPFLGATPFLPDYGDPSSLIDQGVRAVTGYAGPFVSSPVFRAGPASDRPLDLVFHRSLVADDQSPLPKAISIIELRYLFVIPTGGITRGRGLDWVDIDQAGAEAVRQFGVGIPEVGRTLLKAQVAVGVPEAQKRVFPQLR